MLPNIFLNFCCGRCQYLVQLFGNMGLIFREFIRLHLSFVFSLNLIQDYVICCYLFLAILEIQKLSKKYSIFDHSKTLDDCCGDDGDDGALKMTPVTQSVADASYCSFWNAFIIFLRNNRFRHYNYFTKVDQLINV